MLDTFMGVLIAVVAIALYQTAKVFMPIRPHEAGEPREEIAKIIHLLRLIRKETTQMSAELDALKAQVTELEATTQTVVAEIANLKSSSDTAELPAVTARIKAANDALAAA
jgi:hypothetical protein